MSSELIKKRSKYLSMLLRHNPDKANLKLDDQGWCDVNSLLNNVKMDIGQLDEIVRLNDKKRFEYNGERNKIRACQGHSIDIDLGHEPKIPPDVLYHGTAEKFLTHIFNEGILAMSRQHVHLSYDYDTAYRVGCRHGRPCVLKVDAKRMSEEGIQFHQATNGVWLVDKVDPKYFVKTT